MLLSHILLLGKIEMINEEKWENISSEEKFSRTEKATTWRRVYFRFCWCCEYFMPLFRLCLCWLHVSHRKIFNFLWKAPGVNFPFLVHVLKSSFARVYTFGLSLCYGFYSFRYCSDRKVFSLFWKYPKVSADKFSWSLGQQSELIAAFTNKVTNLTNAD